MIGMRRFIVSVLGVVCVTAIEIVAILCAPENIPVVVGISVAGAGAITGIVGSYVTSAAWAKRSPNTGKDGQSPDA